MADAWTVYKCLVFKVVDGALAAAGETGTPSAVGDPLWVAALGTISGELGIPASSLEKAIGAYLTGGKPAVDAQWPGVGAKLEDLLTVRSSCTTAVAGTSEVFLTGPGQLKAFQQAYEQRFGKNVARTEFNPMPSVFTIDRSTAGTLAPVPGAPAAAGAVIPATKKGSTPLLLGAAALAALFLFKR